MTKEEKIKLVEKHIRLRLDPKIYAFSSNTIPNYLKVGDTLRSVDVRISEWEKLINERIGQKPVITKEGDFSALLTDEHYFRDYSVHAFLESVGKQRLDGDLAHKYSVEFFENTDIHDVERAINDIKQDYFSEEVSKKYTYYSVSDSSHTEVHGTNDKVWNLRPNQEEVVNNFLAHPDEKKLLMYAVMRFGKSFTAMYCAYAKKLRKVLIVSAKADVKGEWQKTIETPTCFKNYKFICDTDLKNNFNIENYLSESNDNCVAIFLTLQNLCGKDSGGNNIKKRLKQIYSTQFDLLIVDETHYGAWAHKYGMPLKPLKDADEDVIADERKDFDVFKNKVETISATQQLHLSGTPYNLLYDNKFTQDNIIAMCQYKDILTAKEQWSKEHFDDIENDIINEETGFAYQESDNPYFGFPQMLRFAFNLPYGVREELRKSKSKGTQWSLNDLFATTGEGADVKFIHETAVLDLLKAIDGSKENDEIFSFLNVPKIRDNNVCKHMVFALPFKYSCDAMELLLNENREQFLNLGNYEVLNITGHNLKAELDTVDKVKAHISQCEKDKKKTITLTVYKMLTGVTVKEWDTMIMLKNTQSSQEYDQAIFRIQNQNVQEYIADNGSKFKKDLKPQTILVDFDPVRMFNIQGLSTRIINKVKGNVQSLEETIADELRFSPIIAYNAKNLVEVEPNNLIELILKYNSEKSIIDDVKSVAWDNSLLKNSDVAAYIRSQNPNGLNNSSTKTEAHKGDKVSEFDEPVDKTGDSGDSSGENSGNAGSGNSNGDADTEDKDIAKKYRMCIAKLAFFAFLSKSDVDSLQAILSSLEPEDINSVENNRIFVNLELDEKFIRGLIGSMVRTDALDTDEVIKRANMLSKDEDSEERERALNALNRFNRFSDSEVVTPDNIAGDMCNLIGKDKLVEIVNRGEKILDVASKAGEFAYALYSILKDVVEEEKLRNAIYSIPTSSTAYEFTRRIYESLGLNVDCIAYGSKNSDEAMTSYDLLKIVKQVRRSTDKDVLDYEKIISLLSQDKPFCAIKRTDEITQGDKQVKFGAIVGNPPYQEQAIGDNKNFTPPIYDKFLNLSFCISPIAVLIHPAKFLFNAGRTSKEWNQKMLNDEHFSVLKYFPDVKTIFPNISFTGGVVISYHNDFISFGAIKFFSATQELNDIKNKVWAQNSVMSLSDIIFTQCRYNLDNLFATNSKYKSLIGSGGKDSRFRNNAFEKIDVFTPSPVDIDDIMVMGISKNQRVLRYIKSCYVDKKHDNLSKWKVLVPRANGSGAIGETVPTPLIGTPLIAEPQVAYTQSFIGIGSFNLESEARALLKYIKTKFARVMLGMKKITQDNDREMWRLVPLQDFTENSDIDWSKSISEIDTQLYEKYNLSDEEITFIESMIKPME